jgi:RND superfamily putative drug exporter
VLARITHFAVGPRSRWVVIAAWVVLAFGLGWLQPKLQTKAADESETFRARGAESTRVHELLRNTFPEGRWSTAVVAYVSKEDAIQAHAERVSNDVTKIGGTPSLPDLVAVPAPGGVACGDPGHALRSDSAPSPFSNDQPQTMALVTVLNGRDDTDSLVRDVSALRAIVPKPTASPLAAFVTGPAAFDADRALAVEGLDGTLLAITGVLVLVLMLITYRSPLIAGLMLGVVAGAYLIATGLLYGLVQAGATTVSGQSTAILIVLMFGAGTDYALLIVSRFRDELRRSDDVEGAIERAAARTSPAILASGGIVVVAMLVLELADFNATREMGPILALGIVVMVAAGLTLLPALLGAFGRRAFWPAIPRVEPARPPDARVWRRLGALVRRRPAMLAAVSVAILVAGALGNLEGRGYLTLNEQYREPPESGQGQRLIAERFPPGRVAPATILVRPDVVSRVIAKLGNHPLAANADGDSQSADGKWASLELELKADPFSRAALDSVDELRAAARQAAGGEALVGGITAEEHDNQQALSRDAKLIVPLVLALILGILIVLLRALIAPLYVIGTVVLSFAFALGAASLVFTHVFGQPDSDPNLTIFAFIFLVALGVDDNIFLMTRIREEHRRGLPTRDAVIVGLERTGGVITSAGLILAGTFAALMALDLEALFQVGFTVSLGLLVDAFLVRTFLVPSLAYLLGERNWWP